MYDIICYNVNALATTVGTLANSANATTDAGIVSAGISASTVTPTGTVATLKVIETDPNGFALTSGFAPITATVTNGLLTSGGALPALTSTYIAGTPTVGVATLALSGLTGISGTSTVTVSVNGVVVRTFVATFTGAAAKIVLTAVNSVIGLSGVTGVTANTGALTAQTLDANGNALSIPTAGAGSLTVTPASTTTIASGAITGTPGTTASINLVGSAVGTTSVTVTDGTLVSNAISVRVSAAVPTSVVLSTDLAAYPAGGAGTLTFTLSDAAGTLPAGGYNIYGTGAVAGVAPSSSFALTVGSTALAGVAPTMTVNDSGVATVAFNAPLSDGTTTISGTTSATTIVETPVSFTVSSGASDAANAATDAANEATDAANAATDAANAAADSADAATQAAEDAGAKADAALAAVTALSQQVTSVLAKVAALSALLVRVVKKVKA